MADDNGMGPQEERGPFTNPWPALITGVSASVAALIVSSFATESPSGGAVLAVHVILFGIGVLATGIAVAIRPGSPPVLGLAAFAALAAAVSSDRWDSPSLPSTRLMLGAMAALAAVAAVMMLLPTVWRRAFVSLVILFHFGGILSAVTSAPPGPWLASRLWVVVYRPYLQFMYLNNAYHFYSPEPGPASLLWFRVEYENDPDGTRNWRWVKVPDFDDYGRPLKEPHNQYTRRLSLVESTLQPGPGIGPEQLKDKAQQRYSAGENFGVPMSPNVAVANQYQEPNHVSKRWLGIYARHVARTYPHESKPEREVTGVKIYRVTHQIIGPDQIARGMKANDPTLYSPYFMGEYDQEGKLKDPNDPFLYWLIPIIPATQWKSPTGKKGDLFRTPSTEVVNFLLVHAGDTEAEHQP